MRVIGAIKADKIPFVISVFVLRSITVRIKLCFRQSLVRRKPAINSVVCRVGFFFSFPGARNGGFIVSPELSPA